LIRAAPPSKSLVLTCSEIYVEAQGLHKDAYRRFRIESIFTIKADEDGAAELVGRVADFRDVDLDQVRQVKVACETHREGEGRRILWNVMESTLSGDGCWTTHIVGDPNSPDFGPSQYPKVTEYQVMRLTEREARRRPAHFITADWERRVGPVSREKSRPASMKE